MAGSIIKIVASAFAAEAGEKAADKAVDKMEQDDQEVEDQEVEEQDAVVSDPQEPTDPEEPSDDSKIEDPQSDDEELQKEADLSELEASYAKKLDAKTDLQLSNMELTLAKYGATINSDIKLPEVQSVEVKPTRILTPDSLEVEPTRILTPDSIEVDPEKRSQIQDLITAHAIATGTNIITEQNRDNTQLILDKIDEVTQKSLEAHKEWQDESLQQNLELSTRQAELTAEQIELQKSKITNDSELSADVAKVNEQAMRDDAASDSSANQLSKETDTKSDGPKILSRLKEKLTPKAPSDNKLKWLGILLPIIAYAIKLISDNWNSIKTSVSEWLETGPLSGIVDKMQEWRDDWKYLSDKNYTLWEKIANWAGGGRIADSAHRTEGHMEGEVIHESSTDRSTFEEIEAGDAATYMSNDTIINTKEVATANSKVAVAAMARDDRRVTDEELQALYGAPLQPHKLANQSDKSQILGQFEGFVNKNGVDNAELDYYNILNFTGGALHYYLQSQANRPTYLNDDFTAMALMLSGYSRIKNLTDFADEAGLSPARFNLAYSAILDSYHQSLSDLYQVPYETIKEYVNGLDTTELSNFLKLKRGELGLDSTYSWKWQGLKSGMYRDGYEWTNSDADKQEPNVRPFSMTDNTFSMESGAWTDNANYELLRSLITTEKGTDGSTHVVSRDTSNDKLLSVANRLSEGPYQSTTYQSAIESGSGTFLSGPAVNANSYEHRSLTYLDGSEKLFSDTITNSINAIESASANTTPVDVNSIPAGYFKSIDDGKRAQVFIDTMMPLVRSKLIEHGINPEFDHIVVSQMALESGWGKSESGKFNFSGMKAKKDADGNPTVPATKCLTTEYLDKDGDGTAEKYKIYDWFKDFESLNDYLDYYIPRLRDRFDAFKGDTTTSAFASNIRTKGYYTDSLEHYSDSLSSISSTIKKNYSRVEEGKVDPQLRSLEDSILSSVDGSTPQGSLSMAGSNISVTTPTAIKSPEVEIEEPSTTSSEVPTSTTEAKSGNSTIVNAPQYKAGNTIYNNHTTVNIHQDSAASAEIR